MNGKPRSLLVDTDAFVLLSGVGLLERAVQVVGFELVDTLRLSPVPHMLTRGRAFRSLPLFPFQDHNLEAIASWAGPFGGIFVAVCVLFTLWMFLDAYHSHA